MRQTLLTAFKSRISKLTLQVFNREDRQLLISGAVAMVSLLLLGLVLAWFVVMERPEKRNIALGAAIHEGGDDPFILEPAEAAPEVASLATPQASQLESLSDQSPTRGDLPSLEKPLEMLLSQGSQSVDGGAAPNSDPIAGITDPFNPSAAGLAKSGMFEGRTLLAWTNESYVIGQIFPDDHALWRTLRLIGFDVKLRTGKFKPEYLEGVSQVWIFAGRRSGMLDDDYSAIVRFLRNGGGLYLCGDNVPYLAESKRLCTMLFHCEPKGNYFGEKLLGVYDAYGERQNLQGPQGEIHIQPKNWQDRHALLTGIQCIFEGHTISTLPLSRRLTPVLRASNQRTLAAVSNTELRVVLDGGYTRYDPAYNLSGTEKGAGTLLWATNIAAYLEGIDRSGSNPQAPETLTGR